MGKRRRKSEVRSILDSEGGGRERERERERHLYANDHPGPTCCTCILRTYRWLAVVKEEK